VILVLDDMTLELDAPTPSVVCSLYHPKRAVIVAIVIDADLGYYKRLVKV
jgi:hypothetical protein